MPCVLFIGNESMRFGIRAQPRERRLAFVVLCHFVRLLRRFDWQQ